MKRMQKIIPWGFLSPALTVELESRRAMRQAKAAEARARGQSLPPKLKTEWNAFRSGWTTGQADEAGDAGKAKKAYVADGACEAGEYKKAGRAGIACKAVKDDTKGDADAREGKRDNQNKKNDCDSVRHSVVTDGF